MLGISPTPLIIIRGLGSSHCKNPNTAGSDAELSKRVRPGDAHRLFAFHFAAFLSRILEFILLLLLFCLQHPSFLCVFIFCFLPRNIMVCCDCRGASRLHGVSAVCATIETAYRQPCGKCHQKSFHIVPAVLFTWSMY